MTLMISAEPVPLKTDKHGNIRVGNTRVTLDSLVAAFLTGATPEEILEQYPTLDLADIYAVVTYYLRHRDEVETYLAEQAKAAETVRQKIEATQNSSGIREKLLARKKQA